LNPERGGSFETTHTITSDAIIMSELGQQLFMRSRDQHEIAVRWAFVLVIIGFAAQAPIFSSAGAIQKELHTKRTALESLLSMHEAADGLSEMVASFNAAVTKLSSTSRILSRRDDSRAGSSAGGSTCSRPAVSSSAVKQKVLPWPSLLWSHIPPFIMPRECRQMVRPKPEPPYLAWTEGSAWLKLLLVSFPVGDVHPGGNHELLALNLQQLGGEDHVDELTGACPVLMLLTGH
jgi:hypothetical protein